MNGALGAIDTVGSFIILFINLRFFKSVKRILQSFPLFHHFCVSFLGLAQEDDVSFLDPTCNAPPEKKCEMVAAIQAGTRVVLV